MERQLPQPFLSSEERIALDAAITDLCYGGQASATPDTSRPETSAIKTLAYSRDVICCSVAEHSHCVDVDSFLDKPGAVKGHLLV